MNHANPPPAMLRYALAALVSLASGYLAAISPTTGTALLILGLGVLAALFVAEGHQP